MVIEGKTVKLRPITIADAEFVLALRQREDIACFFLHKVDISVEQERTWIQNSAAAGDLNFLICTLGGEPLGLIALYDIKAGAAEPGRLMSKGDAVQNIEACQLLYDYAFDCLGLNRLAGVVMSCNRKVKSLQSKFGFVYGPQKEQDGVPVYYGSLSQEDYRTKRPYIVALIDKASQCMAE